MILKCTVNINMCQEIYIINNINMKYDKCLYQTIYVSNNIGIKYNIWISISNNIM